MRPHGWDGRGSNSPSWPGSPRRGDVAGACSRPASDAAEVTVAAPLGLAASSSIRASTASGTRRRAGGDVSRRGRGMRRRLAPLRAGSGAPAPRSCAVSLLRPRWSTRSERRIEGILTCRSRRFDPREATVVLGIPVTSVARTLVDLAAVLGPGALARACHEAGVLHRTTPGEVEAVLARLAAQPGSGPSPGGPARRREGHAQHARAQFPPPAACGRPPAARHQSTCRRPPRRLPLARVPPDGRARQLPFHAPGTRGSRTAGANAKLTRVATSFRRYTYGDVCEEPRLMLAELRNLLHHPSWCRHTTPGQDASPPRQARSPGRGCGRPSGARRSGRGRRR